MSDFGSKRYSSKYEALNKRVPENPKYKHVNTVLDTGAAIRKSSSGKDIKKVIHDEVFRRIRLSTLATLMVEVAKDVLDNRVSESDERPNPHRLRSTVDEDVFNLKSVITGVSEADQRSGRFSLGSDKKESIAVKDSPYLLLDVRHLDSYQQCHIITALHYPSSMLCRTCNYETKELLAYKNAPLRLIVLYDEDETIASRVATTLIQRGYDNVFMLSGGLKLAASKFSQGFIAGTIPGSCRPQTSLKRSGQSLPDIKQRSLKTQNLQESFTRDDLEKLQAQLDTVSIHPGQSSTYGAQTISMSCSSARPSSLVSRSSTVLQQPRCSSSKPQHWR